MYKIYYRELEVVKEIPNNIIEYLSRYNNQDRYNQSINAWKLLNDKLMSDFKIDLSKYQIHTTINGKPFIDGIYFSITHTNNLVAVIISDVECGIDLEEIDPRINHSLMAKRVLSNEEFEEYQKVDNKLDYFTLKWTKKEAYLKCYNEGIIEFGNLRKDYKAYSEKVVDSLNNEYYLSFVIKEDVCIK